MGTSFEELFGIKDEVMMITGGTGSIGFGLSKGLMDLGAKVGIMGTSKEKCEKRAKELEKEYSKDSYFFVTADITKEEEVTAAAEAIYSHFGKIDGLINAAGINVIDRLEAISMDDFNWVMNINFTGMVIACRAAGKYMLEAGKGRIINISSLSSVEGKSYYTAYASSKAAINSFTRALAIEWAKKGINVNALCPGMIITDINRKQYEDNPERLAVRVATIPRGVAGRIEWLLSPVVMLLSPGSAHLTGQAIFVDGGSSAGSTFVLDTKRFENK